MPQVEVGKQVNEVEGHEREAEHDAYPFLTSFAWKTRENNGFSRDSPVLFFRRFPSRGLAAPSSNFINSRLEAKSTPPPPSSSSLLDVVGSQSPEQEQTTPSQAPRRAPCPGILPPPSDVPAVVSLPSRRGVVLVVGEGVRAAWGASPSVPRPRGSFLRIPAFFRDVPVLLVKPVWILRLHGDHRL